MHGDPNPSFFFDTDHFFTDSLHFVQKQKEFSQSVNRKYNVIILLCYYLQKIVVNTRLFHLPKIQSYCTFEWSRPENKKLNSIYYYYIQAK